MERGCYLEKRCPACRALKISRRYSIPFKVIGDHYVLDDGSASVFNKWCFYPQNRFLRTITKWSDEHEEEFMESSEDIAIRDQESDMIWEILEKLNHREAFVIESLMRETLEVKEIAQELGVTQPRVSHIYHSGIKKLKHPRLGKKLKIKLGGRV